jgi:excisionase family DNA binding protein
MLAPGNYAGAFTIFEAVAYLKQSNEKLNTGDSMFHTYPDVMSVKQLCKALDISCTTAYGLLREGNLHCLKVGRSYKIPKVNLIKYLCGS